MVLNGRTISITTAVSGEQLNVIGSVLNVFFDSNADSDITLGDNYITITLLNSGDTEEESGDVRGKMIGLIHYIELPSLSVPT